MRFSKVACRKGGQHPASQRQKDTVRERIMVSKPWLASTGPRTRVGKSISSQNAVTHGLSRSFQPIPLEQLQEIWREPEYRQYQRRLKVLAAKRDRESAAFREWARESLLPKLLRRKVNG